ncbi:uncharacterized protein LOC132738199 [Ruditapes philippinarum]|uniref:uncharacterized protein LOC132738199 n=1 Tax=Ruditapes philippinarum TaxID=129788 RepID=UPI00295BDA8C|nr:uncharacterized protein LOC132738199 [Ruditapes philippinarum]
MSANVRALSSQESNEVKEMFCEECENHGDGFTPAIAFCVDCVEYKCVTCLKYHKRQSKTHKIQDSDSMPKDFYFEKCSTHPLQLIKFYCSECSKEACQECKDNDHVKCGDVNHLPTLASGIQKCDDLKDLQQNLDRLLEEIKDTEKLLHAKSEVVDKQEEEATEAFKEHREKLIEIFIQQHQDVIDAFDKEIEETIARMKKEGLELVNELSENERKFKNQITKAENDVKEKVVSTNKDFKVLKSEHLNLVKQLKAHIAELEEDQKLGQNCELLIKLKFTKQMCENIHRNIKQIQQAYIQRFKIETFNIQAKELSLVSERRFFTFAKVHASYVERRVVFDFDINCHIDVISSLLVLSEHTLLVSDYAMCYLDIYKLGMSQANYIDSMNFKTNPFGIIRVSDYKIAVTFPKERIIRLITFFGDMKVLNITEIPGNGPCTGIAYKNNYLVVSYWNPASVKILSMSGEIVKTFDKDDNGRNLFIEPWYLTVSPDNTVIYVSGWEKHTVTCLTFAGKVKAVYKNDQLKRPQQLAVDEYGSLYVCGIHSGNIHQLSNDLTKVKILIDKSDGLDQPKSVAYCPNTKRLFVGMYNKIKVFNVLLE